MSVNAELSVEGMNNGGRAIVEKKLTALDGVDKVNIDMDANTVTVSYDESKTNLVNIKQSIMEEGLTVIEI